MTRIGKDDMDRLREVEPKPRPRGTLPYLPAEDDPILLRDWLTRAFRPPEGYHVQSFERAGRDMRDPCSLIVANGRDSTTYRFAKQGDLCRSPRVTVFSVTDGKLRVPHLTASEVEDVWACLCLLGQVLTEWDETDETTKWLEQMIGVTMPIQGFTLAPDGRYDALMALRRAGEFTRSDALALVRPGTEDTHFQQRPARLVDVTTGDQWVRAGETACYVRWVCGVEPLSHGMLRARLQEIGVVGRLFEDHRGVHPKANLYQLSDALVAGITP